MEENEEITKFISTLESKSMEEEANIIPLLEKANKYIIVLNKSITEGISKLKELYSPYFPELPTIVTNSYEYVQSIKVIKENKSLLKSDTKSGIEQLKLNLLFLFIITVIKQISDTQIIDNKTINVIIKPLFFIFSPLEKIV